MSSIVSHVRRRLGQSALSFIMTAAAREGLRAANLTATGSARLGYPICVAGTNVTSRTTFASAEDLVRRHFDERSDPGHVNLSSMLDTVLHLGERPSLILETGSSAWGTNSSELFDDYVTAFGGEFHTVDVRLQPMLHLRTKLGARSWMACDDSVRFLRRWVERNPTRVVDLVYLDSWDLDVSSPLAAAIHALRELEAIRPALGAGSLLLVDDTPAHVEWFPEQQREAADVYARRHGMVPGKGMLVDVCLDEDDSVVKLHHRYQALYRFF